jgi:hypothetical protein
MVVREHFQKGQRLSVTQPRLCASGINFGIRKEIEIAFLRLSSCAVIELPRIERPLGLN